METGQKKKVIQSRFVNLTYFFSILKIPAISTPFFFVSPHFSFYIIVLNVPTIKS